MQMKKSPSANLENKRFPLFLLGILCATALVLTAFEWRTFETTVVKLPDQGESLLMDETVLASYPRKKEVLKPPPRPVVDEFILTDQLIDEAELPLFPEIDLDGPTLHQLGFEEELAVEDTIYMVVEERPQFPGGEEALFKFLQNNIKYPIRALDAGVGGSVYVTFVVNKNGEITNVEMQQGVGWGLDEEAMRVVNAMPKWSPGKQRGIPVNVRYNLPIKYTAIK